VGRHRRTRAPRLRFAVTAPLVRPALVLVACLALLPPQPAVAQGREESPSARELWEAYPLRPSPEPGADRPAEPAPAASPAPSARPRDARSSQATLSLVVAAVLAIIAFAAGFALSVRPSRRRSHAQWTLAAPDSEQGASQPSRTASRPWTAEIEWWAAGGEACFRAVAQPGEVVVAESARLPWPPSGAAEEVPTLATAAGELEARLVRAGWRPLPPGDAWYAKRFAWEPVVDGRFEGRPPPDHVPPISTPTGRTT
jgi:hypothetical protein